MRVLVNRQIHVCDGCQVRSLKQTGWVLIRFAFRKYTKERGHPSLFDADTYDLCPACFKKRRAELPEGIRKLLGRKKDVSIKFEDLINSKEVV